MKYFKRYRARIKSNPKDTLRWYYWRKDILPPVGVERDTTAWFDWIWGKTEGRNLEGIEVIVQEHSHPTSFQNQLRYICCVYYQCGKFGDYVHQDDLDILECLGEFDTLGKKKK